MNEETYYTVLNVKETASPSEIKTAYRDLIKQVHPDTIATLAPYLRRIAEDKVKEITEAYTVLSNSNKRRDYDRQLAEYRRQHAPQAPPSPTRPAPAQQGTSQTSSGPYCNTCGTPLYASGFCPGCQKFAAPSASPPQTVVRRFGNNIGYNGARLMRWSREHPILALAISVFLVWLIGTALSSNTTSSQPDLNCPPSQRAEVNGRFVCQQQPVQPPQAPATSNAVSPATPGVTVAWEESAPSKPTVSVSGTYSGTVHNKTANLSSTVVVVLRQTKAGDLQGCMQVKPPLSGSGAVQGRVRGAHVNFVVADIAFRGDALKDAITGFYVVSRQESQQLGEFRLERRKESDPQYFCDGGTLTDAQTKVKTTHQADVIVVPPEKPHPSRVEYAVVVSDYAAIEKRCAFLPSDNYRRCNFQPETIARPRKFDRLTILSPLTRAENGEDIYKVRTAQGWEGWIDSRLVEVQQ